MRRALQFFLLLPLAAVAQVRSDEVRPNILFAIADDWGIHAGAYGTPWVKTPGFDRVAREGVLFTRAYTPVAKCAPSRAIVLTGRHAWQLEEAGNHMAVFPPKFRSWPEVLMEAGWHVGITGKGWGPGRALDAAGEPRQITGIPYNKRKLTPLTTGISKNDYAANFVDFLDAAPADAPWCFWYGSTEPHRGYEFRSGVEKGGKKLSDIDRVPDYWPDNETVRHDMLDYALEVEHTDNHLVAMIAELERRGALDNTVIIVTSDHGMPFPRVKGYAYPDSNHIPLAIRWPAGMATPGRVVEDFVDFTDIAPTLLDLAGIEHLLRVGVRRCRLQIFGEFGHLALEGGERPERLDIEDGHEAAVIVLAGRLDAGEPRVQLVLHVAAQDAVLDQHVVAARRALVVDRQRAAAIRQRAVVHDRAQGGRDALADADAERGGALAVEIAFEPVPHRLVQQHAGPSRAQHHGHRARRRRARAGFRHR